MWEVVVAYFKVLSQHSPEVTMEKKKRKCWPG